MTTIILGLGALTIVMGYNLRIKGKEIDKKEIEIYNLKEVATVKRMVYESDIDFLEDKHKKEKENWKQTSSAWILEKEEMIERLEREKFNQLHELALMLDDSYEVDRVILKKAELHDYLLHNANRRQRREFIEKGQFEL